MCTHALICGGGYKSCQKYGPNKHQNNGGSFLPKVQDGVNAMRRTATGASFWTETSCFHLYPMGLVPSSSPPSHCCAPSQMKIMDAPPSRITCGNLHNSHSLVRFFTLFRLFFTFIHAFFHLGLLFYLNSVKWFAVWNETSPNTCPCT